MRKTLLPFLLLLSFFANSQQLTYASRGRVKDSNNNIIAPAKVREMLMANQNALNEYNAGRSKKTLGNVLLIGGSTLLVADLGLAFYTGQWKPNVLTIAGPAAMIAAIPVKIGFTKKIKSAIDGHNSDIVTSKTQPDRPLFAICANSCGVGLQIQF